CNDVRRPSAPSRETQFAPSSPVPLTITIPKSWIVPFTQPSTSARPIPAANDALSKWLAALELPATREALEFGVSAPTLLHGVPAVRWFQVAVASLHDSKAWCASKRSPE